MKRILAILSACLFFCLFLVGCDRNASDDINDKIDTKKTQLYVGNFSGGFGHEWLNKARVRFEQLYSETSFQEGKKGVQIWIEPISGDTNSLKNKLRTSREEVFFYENVFYYDFINEDLFLDISDVVTTSMTEFGDSNTIESKLTDDQKNFFKTSDNKYYAVPHYAGYSGLVYDRDLFENENLFFKKDWNDNLEDIFTTKQWYKAFIANESEEKSSGPDGQPNTYDDGLPATYDEFAILCNYMADDKTFQPLTWSGINYNLYLGNLMTALYANHEGKEQYMLNYTFDGEANTIVNKITPNGSSTVGTVELKQNIKINEDNAYLLFNQAGKYYSTKFIENIITNNNWYDVNKQFSQTTHSHTEAQDDFLYSSADSKNKSIAMLVDGCWWESEADSTFTQMVSRIGDRVSKYKRNFAFLPLPKATTAEVGSKNVLLDDLYSLGFISAKIDSTKVDLAKKFLMFVNTDESLAEFTTTTNTTKALKYNISDSQKAQMSNFGRSVYEMQQISDIVYPYSNNTLYMNNQPSFYRTNIIKSVVQGTTYVSPMQAIYNNKISAEDLFSGYLKNAESIWTDLKR